MIGSMGRAATVGLLAALCTSGCSAQEEAQQSFKSLIARGFKVVATSVISSEYQPDKKSVIVVTLQQDKAVAVCTVGLAGWENLHSVCYRKPEGLRRSFLLICLLRSVRSKQAYEPHSNEDIDSQ